MNYRVGNIYEGVVKKITSYGAFIEFPDGKKGLVHISEIANTYVRDINDFLKIDQKVQVKFLTINEDGKIDLSIKQAQKSSSSLQEKRSNLSKVSSSGSEISFEEKLAKFMKESEERIRELQRHTEDKRGGRRK